MGGGFITWRVKCWKYLDVTAVACQFKNLPMLHVFAVFKISGALCAPCARFLRQTHDFRHCAPDVCTCFF